MNNGNRWLVIHQQVPFSANHPSSLVVESRAREGAFAVTFDYLAKRGFSMYSQDEAVSALKLNVENVRLCGVPASYGTTHVRSIEKYQMLQDNGRVIGDPR
jgi:hypothetical protein